MAASTCIVASPPIGPSQACGAMEMPETSAIAPTFHNAVMPPTWLISVCRISTTPISISSRQPYEAIRRSPVAMGVVERRAILRHGLHVFRRAGLFDEEQVQRLHFFDDDRSHARAGLGVEIDGDIDIGTETLAQELHRFDRAVDLGVRLDPLVITRDAALEAGDALFAGGLAELRQFARGVDAVGVIVAAYAARIEGAAKQLVDWHAEHFAANVPQRLVDAGDRGARSPGRRDRSCARTSIARWCSTCIGSAPIRKSRKSLMHAITAPALPSSVPSPQPMTPWLVSSFTNT